ARRGINVPAEIVSPSPKLQSWARDEKGYINPMTNEWEDWTRLTAAHIYPRELIEKLPGYDRLTRDQQNFLLNYPGNCIPLPKQWNSSMGSRLADEWATTPRGSLASKEYIDNLRESQQAYKVFAEGMIKFFLGE